MSSADPTTLDLLAHQTSSFYAFAQPCTPPGQRAPIGLEAALRDAFPLRSFNETSWLEYGGYRLDVPREDPQACRAAGRTYAGALHVTLRVLWFEPRAGGNVLREVREQEVPFGELPWMTDEGTFVIAGEDRVVQPQLARCPGVWFERLPPSRPGREEHLARIEPARGPRVEIHLNHARRLRARVGSGRWVPATALPRALGMTRAELLRSAYATERLVLRPDGGLEIAFDPDVHLGHRMTSDLVVDGRLIAAKYRKLTRSMVRQLVAAGVTALPVRDAWLELLGRVVADDVVDERQGELLAEAGQLLDDRVLAWSRAAGVREIPLLATHVFRRARAMREPSTSVLDTEMASRIESSDQAAAVVLRSLARRGAAEPVPTGVEARAAVRRLLGDPEMFDLGVAGRARTNRQLYTSGEARALSAFDLVQAMVQLGHRAWGEPPDDPTDLTGALLRPVGALLEQAARRGLAEMALAVRERLELLDPGTFGPSDCVPTRPFERRVRELFTRSRVSRRLDRTNPAAALAQSRFCAAVDPEAGSARRSGFVLEAGSVTQYGYLCPVEAPAPGGPPGSALALLACVGAEGVIERPVVRELGDDVVPAGEVRHISAFDRSYVGACEPERVVLDPSSASPPLLEAALGPAGVAVVPSDQVTWRETAPEAGLGVLAALVPFAAHDDPAAVCDGAANIRRARPPLHARPPRVRTGLEAAVARASGGVVRAGADGVVERADAGAVVVRHADGGARAYALRGIADSAGGGGALAAPVRERPCVRAGDAVRAGYALAEGAGVAGGALACGDDVLVALASWAGLTDGCALVVSERLVREGRLACVRVAQLTRSLGRAPGGRLALARDAPDTAREERGRLDARGVVRVGARVACGELLAGCALTPAHGAPVGASWRAPRGAAGVVVRAEVDKPESRAPGTSRLRVLLARLEPLAVGDVLGSRHGDRGVVARVVPEEDLPFLPDGRAVEAIVNPAAVVERGAVGILCEMRAGGGAEPIAGHVRASAMARAAAAVDEDARGGDTVVLRDGRSGEAFAARVCVGPLHLMRLAPEAPEDGVAEFDARSRGPRDAATQQPRGDEQTAPGQPFDEDAVWAVVAYGAAHALRETLTARGDDARAAELLDASILAGGAPAGAAGGGAHAGAVFLKTLQAAGLEVRVLRPPRAAR